MATQITLAQCRALATAPGFSLRADAADAWDRAVRAFGSRVLLSGAWRSYATQERIFRERYVRGNHRGKAGFTTDVRRWQGVAWTRRAGTAAAAVPGTSNHGSGLAVDVKTRRSAGDPAHPAAVVFASFGDADRLRFLQVARPHGWADDEGLAVFEPWHLTYYPARDRRPAAGVSVTQPTAPEEDIMATIADLERVIGDARTKPRLYKVAGTAAACLDLGPVRRYLTRDQYVAMGSPPITSLPVDDLFWRLTLVGSQRESYRRPGQEACWVLEPHPDPTEHGRLHRRWPDRAEWERMGWPQPADLAPDHPVWSLPTMGDLPPEGA